MAIHPLLRKAAENKDWTLFLDRDGVLNEKRENDYVKKPEEFLWIDGVLDALQLFNRIFKKIIIVTNQRGIARGLYSVQDLTVVHNEMLKKIKQRGGRIDAIYYCPHLGNESECNCRKPKPGMALQAKRDFPEIDFDKSIMIGDSMCDIEFGKHLGMLTVTVTQAISDQADLTVASLHHFSTMLHV